MDSRLKFIEPNIIKTAKEGGYRVKIGIRGYETDTQFETLEQARAYRDKIYDLRDTAELLKIKAKLDFKEYPENLIKSLGFEDIFDIFENFNKYYEVIKTKLTDREEKVIDCIFHQHMTLQETGKEFGVTRERIRQVQIKALKKIKRYRYYFEVGEYADKKELAKQDYQKYLEQSKKEWKYEEAKEFVKNYESEHKQKIAMKAQIGIENLDLSVRSFNCLRRAGIRYLSELLSKSVEDLMKIRNMGKKSLKEIIDKLEQQGYHLKEFER